MKLIDIVIGSADNFLNDIPVELPKHFVSREGEPLLYLGEPMNFPEEEILG